LLPYFDKFINIYFLVIINFIQNLNNHDKEKLKAAEQVLEAAEKIEKENNVS